MKKLFIILILCLNMFGCASSSSNMRVGQDQTYISLSEQRDAVKNVKIIKNISSDYKLIGHVEASRCHRNFLENEPLTDNIIIDLQVSAFAKGADAITNISFDDSVGGAILKNCWHIKNGYADMYSKL